MLINALSVEKIRKTLRCVRTIVLAISTLRKQTILSRPNDAALCEAAIAAQAQLRTSMTNVDVNCNVGLGYLTQCQMPQSTFFDQTSTSSCVPPPESPVVSQWVVEPEGLASTSFGVASGQCHRAPALRTCRASFTE